MPRLDLKLGRLRRKDFTLSVSGSGIHNSGTGKERLVNHDDFDASLMQAFPVVPNATPFRKESVMRRLLNVMKVYYIEISHSKVWATTE